MPWVAVNNRHSKEVQVHLRVLCRESFVPEDATVSLSSFDLHCGLINLESLKSLPAEVLSQVQELNFVPLFARTHAQFVLKVKLCRAVPVGCIVLNEAQRINFEVTHGPETFPWSVYSKVDRMLSSILFEIRPRYVDSSGPITVERAYLREKISKALWETTVTMHERLILQIEGKEYALRVKELELQEEEGEEEGEEGSLFIEDAFRGVMDTRTRIALEEDKSFTASFTLMGKELEKLSKPLTHVVDVICNDEEWFPVKKRLLQPCIALAKSVLSTSSEREKVHVDVDCCTFDKVLLFLEAEAKGEEFKFELYECDQLLEAAEKLKLIGLQRSCERKQGEYKSSIRAEIPWEEVKERNANGELLLVIDNCVCNVTEWLEYHPGGNTIIPEQALNVDATVLFEVYHASRESFLFLKQLYIGMLRPEDRHLVPPPRHQVGQSQPSEPFLEQFREFMGQIKLFKSF